MIITAYAKINLALHVVGRRRDGFHDIETIFHRIGLYDEITIGANDDIRISCTDPSVPLDDRNLCWKAVAIVQREAGIRSGASIDIIKRIPPGGGLGGGSSNAAAVLRHLPALWKTNLGEDVLRALALEIGSDVPFFLSDVSAYGAGRGEQLTPLSLRLPWWIVVITPPIHVSTAWAYAELAKKRNNTFPQRPSLVDVTGGLDVKHILSFGNDFEEVVLKAFPEIRAAKDLLTSHGALHALLSGSGASVFGLFDSRAAVDRLQEHTPSSMFIHITEPNFVPPA